MKPVIQIAVTSGPDGSYPDLVYALTADGIYFIPYTATESSQWKKLPPIPEDKDIKF